MKVADIILEQLGGNKFLAMTGAKKSSGRRKHASHDASEKPQ